MNHVRIAAAFAMVPLAACQTTSFAPPPVNPQLVRQVGGASGCGPRTVLAAEEPITHDVKGAMALTDNFILAYRCAERELANGRQAFQLPSFAAAAIGLVGPTLGLGPDSTLIAGTSAGVFNTGNSYYAPRTKAGIVSAAHRALVCIKTEAAGVSYFHLTGEGEGDGASAGQAAASDRLERMLTTLQAQEVKIAERRGVDPNAEAELATNRSQQQAVTAAMVGSALNAAATADSGSVGISAEVQYFQMVSGALLSVESILAERLRDVGSADTKEIFAQLTKLAEEHAAAKKKLEEAKGAAGQAGIAELGAEPDLVELENAVLQPRLQTCVLEARN